GDVSVPLIEVCGSARRERAASALVHGFPVRSEDILHDPRIAGVSIDEDLEIGVAIGKISNRGREFGREWIGSVAGAPGTFAASACARTAAFGAFLDDGCNVALTPGLLDAGSRSSSAVVLAGLFGRGYDAGRP